MDSISSLPNMFMPHSPSSSDTITKGCIYQYKFSYSCYKNGVNQTVYCVFVYFYLIFHPYDDSYKVQQPLDYR